MLQNEAVRSAQIYLDYLIAHRDEGLGLVRARVRGIQGSLMSGEMMLITDRVLRFVDALVVRIGGTVYENNQGKNHFRILSHDRRKIVIAPSEELAAHIESAWESKEPIDLESDLTFLVERVRDWYQAHGDKVELPSQFPGELQCKLASDNPIPLSENQYHCAELAMSSPLAYIWGAPGTGKTKHVLASCVLSYIRAGKKVILAAPTNNALEQSLSGLLLALSEEGGINPAGKVIRLGVPGDTFRMVWPDVCEEGATVWMRSQIMEKINELDYRLSRIEKSLTAKTGKADPAGVISVDGGFSMDSANVDPFPDKSIQELQNEKKQYTTEKNDLLARNRKLKEKGLNAFLSEFSVVACTVDCCISRISPNGDFKPDHIFLDEAGYCNVIKGMTLLGFEKPITLLGDHMQLPPVFEGEQDMLKDPKKKLARLWKISSLYMENVVMCEDLEAFCEQDPEKPVFDHTEVGALTETHRFGPELAAVLAKRIYGQRFCSRSENETKILFINAPKSAKDREREEGKHQRVSHREARCARSLMESNLSHSGITVGIITPYRRQRRLLSESMDSLLKKYHMEDEDMDEDIVTVHQSQGREWDVVLFSITDAFDEMFFTNSRKPEALKLINTAVSRARKMLIIIGDAEDWKGKPGQLISELFAVGKEISDKERIVDSIRSDAYSDSDAPWMDNYGSLYMALSMEDK